MEDNKPQILIVGAGEIGQALGKVLKEKASVSYWDKDEVKLNALGFESGALPDLVASAQIIFFCVPSWAMREALVYTSPYMSKSAIAVSVAKGIDPKSGQFMDELLSKALPKGVGVAILGGALIAEDLLADNLGQGVIATSSAKNLKTLLEIFEGTRIKVSPWTDLRSLALAGVFKNVYALGYGIVSGLAWKDNSKGVYLSQSIEEMMKLQETLKGKKNATLAPHLLGDFFATCLSTESLNHQVGQAIARGDKYIKISEGYSSLPVLLDLVSKKVKSLPILQTLEEVVIAGHNPQESFTALEKVL